MLKSKVKSTRSTGAGGGSAYMAVIEYEYCVDDVPYTHDHAELVGIAACVASAPMILNALQRLFRIW